MADSKSAAERVFGTFELAEDIIKDLSATQLLQFQRVNRAVRKTIWSSPITRETLFLDADPFSERNSQRGYRKGAVKNPIPGLPFTSTRNRHRLWGRHVHISFSNKMQARAVLLKDRNRYSWEDMYPFAPLDGTCIHLRYLAEENVAIAAGAEELSWMTERSVLIAAEVLTFGAALRIAAKVVLDDIHAWDPDTPNDDRDDGLTLFEIPAKAYLKFFQFEVDEDAEMDLDSDDLKKQWSYDSNFDTISSPLILLKTWPWTKDMAKTASDLELEWLCRSDRQRVVHGLLQHTTLYPPLYKTPTWALKLQPPSTAPTAVERLAKYFRKRSKKERKMAAISLTS